ncbi:Detected protein of confused Function [Hibiscus syriacus]|uniref:Detected protein of confused Function n=1 Tax=Hibiscus syriacus TaxID=106335 RepID=A0A6A2WQI2_HIBSY|nr:protein SICKLE-like [Hibiscus syriacus]XP_039045634.1 protein SICKLE-like [Hibiscus syriacus]KAE8663093.1 Detected protein of confused Function [Hibiscus syriacus]
MDESEKRKERLKAMRMEAEVSNDVETSAMPGCLSNPLIETPLTMENDFGGAPRFDYYTDPMAAFSANKKRGNIHNQNVQQSFTSPTTSGWHAPSHPEPRNFNRDLPIHQMQSQFSHAQVVYNHGPYNPRIRSPSLMHQGQSDAWNGSQATDHYNLVSDGTLRGMFGNPPRHPGTSQMAWNPSNTSTYGNLRGPGISLADRPSVNYGTARPRMFGNRPILDQGSGGNPYLSPGRGRSHGYSGSSTPGLGRSFGRGQGFHGRSSASNRILGPESYFDESMLEDPWQHLEPIPWKGQEAGMDGSSTLGTSNSWLPKSIGPKKAKVSEASSNKFNSQQSLAEYLAASFNKAVEDTENE